MKYKLLVLDLDGTLTNKQKKITPHTKETLLKIQEQGVKIVLASGRPTYGIAPLAEQLELQNMKATFWLTTAEKSSTGKRRS